MIFWSLFTFFQQTLFITTEQNSEKLTSPPTQYYKQTNKKKKTRASFLPLSIFYLKGNKLVSQSFYKLAINNTKSQSNTYNQVLNQI